MPHLRNFQPWTHCPKVVRRQSSHPLNGGSNGVGRLAQQPLPGVLAQGHRTDGILRQGRDGSKKVGSERLIHRDPEGTGDDGECQRLMAGSTAAANKPAVLLERLRGKNVAPDLEQPASHFHAGFAQLTGQQLGGQQAVKLRNRMILVNEAYGQAVRESKLLPHKCRKPHPEAGLVPYQPALNVGLKAE